MLLFKFISLPLIWWVCILLCSLRSYDMVEFDFWGINDYTLFTSGLYIGTTFTTNVILRRQLIYDVLHTNARTISFCTGIFMIFSIELARFIAGYPYHTAANFILFVFACYLGNVFFKRIYIGKKVQ